MANDATLEGKFNKHPKTFPKKLWACNRKTRDKSQMVLNIDRNTCQDKRLIVDYVNDYFTTTADKLLDDLSIDYPAFDVQSDPIKQYYSSKIGYESLELQAVTTDFIFKELNQVKIEVLLWMVFP